MNNLNPIEIALIKPKEWEDNTLYNYILPTPQAFKAEILSINQGKVTRVKMYLENINQIVWGVFFVFKSWHKIKFKVGNRLFIRGLLQDNQIIQPKVITQIDKIIPIYKEKNAKKLIKNLTINSLSILPKNIAEVLYYMHFPRDKNDIDEKKINYALKWAEIFNYLYKLRHKKKIFPAKPIKKDITPFINSLPFKLTNDQIKVIKEIQNDLSKPIQARRVIIGDVGSGKTIVMLATAFLSEKSIIMCPTSILANQIFEEANKYLSGKWKMENGKFKTVLVTQKSKFTQKDLEEANLLIGTHALLYQTLPKVNTIMVDEQHRFGTNQRNLLQKLVESSTKPHFFQFSATPIPRTQALIMSSFVNVSLIKELPFKKDIETKIIDKSDFKELINHINREIHLKNQVIIVYPLVEESQKINYQSIEEAKEWWLKHFDGVYVTHGKDKNKEDILIEFREKGNILVTTTVIEVGISLPRLTTIVIVGAERLGLATLHQLRGRVGRYGQKGYCFLYTNDKNNKRLIEFSKTLDGFRIAELDLKFRKAGDILDGKNQSGESFRYFDEVKDLSILEDVKKYIANLKE